MADPRTLEAVLGEVLVPDVDRPGAVAAPAVRVGELCFAALLRVEGAPAPEDLHRRLGALGFGEPPPAGQVWFGEELAAFWTGPAQWELVSAAQRPRALIGALRDALAGSGAGLVDLSHGRVAVCVAGAGAAAVLAAGCPLDLEALGANACASSTFAGVAVRVHRHHAERFDLYVARSYAHWLAGHLLEAAGEFGCRVEAPGAVAWPVPD